MLKNVINPDDTINYEVLTDYIKFFGVNQIALQPIITNAQIKLNIKLNLIGFLIKQGLILNQALNQGSLVLALEMPDLELANLLLANGASVLNNYDRKNLLDVAINLKKEEKLLWVLNNAQVLLLEFSKEKFTDYNEKILHAFPAASEQLKQTIKKINNMFHQNPIKKTVIEHLNNFKHHISKEEITLILAVKMEKKLYPNSIFVIDDNDIPVLIEQIKNLLENDTTENVIRFQIIHHTKPHTIFGEFVINKNIPMTVDYLHCDTVPHKTPYKSIITKDFVSNISPLANIEIYDSCVSLQKAMGCQYFSIDGAMMLAIPPELPYAVDVIEHMQKFGKEEKTNFAENIKYVKSLSLPVRFLRGLQFIPANSRTGPYADAPTIYGSIFNTREKDIIVNKKNETAETTIKKDLKEIEHDDVVKTYNVRAERKMQQYCKEVSDFIKDKDILSSEYSDLLDKYKIKGLSAFCNSQIKMDTKNKINF